MSGSEGTNIEIREAAWEADVPAKDPETGSRAPGDGACRRCGERKPLNRFKLCYRCWCHCRIERSEHEAGRVWRPGMPHPASCDCALPEHKRGENPGPGAGAN